MFPKSTRIIKMTVNPGDVMSAEVQYIGNDNFLLTLTNLTTNQTFQTAQSAMAPRQSGDWVVEAHLRGGPLPLAKFGTETFTSARATVNGHRGTVRGKAWQ